jgi:hypothetical protein
MLHFQDLTFLGENAVVSISDTFLGENVGV